MRNRAFIFKYASEYMHTYEIFYAVARQTKILQTKINSALTKSLRPRNIKRSSTVQYSTVYVQVHTRKLLCRNKSLRVLTSTMCGQRHCPARIVGPCDPQNAPL